MNIKQEFDKMIEAKITAEKEIGDFLLELARDGKINVSDTIVYNNRFRDLLNKVVEPFSG